MNERQARDLVSMAYSLVQDQHALRALAVCGSWARGNPRPDSDLDILIVAQDVVPWRNEQRWVGGLPFEKAQLAYRSHRTAKYGVAWSAHICLEPDAELELTFVSTSWTCVDPIDPGTRDVVSDAFRIIVDKDGHLARLAAVCARGLPV